MRAALIVVVVLLLGVPALADRAVPFAAGETLTYDVSWTRFLTAGVATLVVRERRSVGGGKFGFDIVAEAKPTTLVERLYHLYYKAETLLDAGALVPSWTTLYSDEGGRTRLRTMKVLPGNLIDYEVRTTTAVRSQFQAQPGAVDPVSALYVLRTLVLDQGQSKTIPVFNNGKNYRVDIESPIAETVTTGIGPAKAWRFTPIVKDEQGHPVTTRNLTVWISDDARRLPLQITVDLPVGSFRLTLAKVNAPGVSPLR